jgi:hypothetical protein
MDAKGRSPRVRCKHCEVTFLVPERIEMGDGRRVQLQCPRKECGEWSWYELHEIGLGPKRVS